MKEKGKDARVIAEVKRLTVAHVKEAVKVIQLLFYTEYASNASTSCIRVLAESLKYQNTRRDPMGSQKPTGNGKEPKIFWSRDAGRDHECGFTDDLDPDGWLVQ